jgi:radical SAM superfamily enzyme YgiQ (UPF0313 family)
MKVAFVSVYPCIQPPIGLASLATYLREKTGFKDIRIIDKNFEDPVKSTLAYNPDIIGVSAMTIYYNSAVRYARTIKKRLNVPIIIGGVHISTLPSSFKSCFDIAVIGEGEQTMLELFLLYKKKGKFEKRDLKKIHGIAFYDKGKLVMTKRRKLIEPLDDIPIPDRRLLNKKYYVKKKLFAKEYYGIEDTLITSRGCPYNCRFCSTSAFWGPKVRFNSADRVVEEIKRSHELLNVDHINIVDDTFGVNRERLRDVVNGLKKAGLLGKISYACLIRVSIVDDELLRLLKEMNMVTLNFGFESGSDRVLSFLKYPATTVEQNRNALLKAKRHGFRVYGSFILGSPTETIQEMRETLRFIEFAVKHKIDYIFVFPLKPFPSTKMWEIAKQRGVVSDDMDFEKLGIFVEDFYEKHKPLLVDESIDMEEYKRIYSKAVNHSKNRIARMFLGYLMHHPMLTIKNDLKNPFLLVKKYIRFRTDVYDQ